MDEKPKSIWKKPLRLPQLWMVWLGLMVATMLIFLIVKIIVNDRFEISWLMIVGAVTATVLLAGWIFMRWLCCWRNLRRSLFALACFATLIALFYAEEDWRGWHTWNQFKHEWEAKGEHFDMASVAPAPVPAEQNFALTPIAFTGYGYILTRDGKRIPSEQRDTNFVQRINMEITHDYNGPTNVAGNREKGKFTNLEGWQSYYRERAATTNEFAVPAQPQSPAADVLLALSKYDPVVEELRAASRLPCSRFPLEYTNESPAAILLPHLAALKRCTLVLQLRSLAELQNGQPEKALDDVLLALQLTDKIRTEPFLISHLVRIAMLQITLQPLWEGLAEHKWSDEQLVALDAELAKLDFLADYEFAMCGERAFAIAEFESQRRTHESKQWEEINGTNKIVTISYRFMPSAFFYQNELAFARMHEQWTLP